VFDEIAVLQSRERGADRALIETGLRGDFVGLKRAIIVGSEKSEDLIRDGKFLEFVLARLLEGISVDGHR
jgi:hypothetical protein